MMSRHVTFRVDASLAIGTGHVMRCLTLADALRQRGVECHFICREHEGHLIDQVRGKGYTVHPLPKEEGAQPGNGRLAHAEWLNATQAQDAAACAALLQQHRPDCLIVDHYALDAQWETALRPLCKRLMVIDDLADRQHDCDLLLDQNLGRPSSAYAQLTPPHCLTLLGPLYALLRPEFAAQREYSLARRTHGAVRNILITMGGVDQPNATGAALEALKDSELPDDCRIAVVMGPKAPWLRPVREIALQMPWPTEVLVDVRDMARIMADADLAIGAAGTSAWERCCVGLPSINWILAENQRGGAHALAAAGCAVALPISPHMPNDLLQALTRTTAPGQIETMQKACAAVTDGLGASRVAAAMERCHGK